MGLETGTYISDLVVTNPLGADLKSTADDHLRLIKACLKSSFTLITGAMTATHTELNYSVGVTSGIQAQFTAQTAATALKGAIAGQTWTGTHAFAATTSIGNVSATEIAYLDGVTSAIQTQIDTKGAIAGQAWTGAHTFPTKAALNNSTSAATTAYADVADALVASTAATATALVETNAAAATALKANKESPTFTGIPAAPTAVTGTSTTQLATTAFVVATSFVTSLPGQTGNSGKYVTTDGTNARWAVPVGISIFTASTLGGF